MGSAAMTSATTARVHHTGPKSIAKLSPNGVQNVAMRAASRSGNSAGVADGEAAPARPNGGAVSLRAAFDPLRTLATRGLQDLGLWRNDIGVAETKLPPSVLLLPDVRISSLD